MGTIRHAILLIGALLLSHQGFAAEFTVDSTVDDVDLTPGDGVCVTAPGQCTLRAAIQETNALNGVDTINLPSGTYELTIPSESSESEDRQGQQYVDESGDLDIIDELTIIGSGLEATVIDATSVSARVVHIAPGATVRLEGLRIQGGRGVEDGGGIHNAGVLTMGDCVVSDNNAEQYHHYFPSSGGGIYNSGTLMLHETAVHHNSAQSGGGIQNEGGDISMFNGALYSNHARIYSLRPTLRRPGWGEGFPMSAGPSFSVA